MTNHRTHCANLAWCMALFAATRAVEEQRGAAPGTLPIATQYEIAAALAAGLIAYAEDAEAVGLSWVDALRVAGRELEESSRWSAEPR